MPRARVPGWDLQGWIEISLEVGLHEDTCRRMSQRDDDPLPVLDYFGLMVAHRADVRAWIARQAKPRRAIGA